MFSWGSEGWGAGPPRMLSPYASLTHTQPINIHLSFNLGSTQRTNLVQQEAQPNPHLLQSVTQKGLTPSLSMVFCTHTSRRGHTTP